jgi:hypothetical protein
LHTASGEPTTVKPGSPAVFLGERSVVRLQDLVSWQTFVRNSCRARSGAGRRLRFSEEMAVVGVFAAASG